MRTRPTLTFVKRLLLGGFALLLLLSLTHPGRIAIKAALLLPHLLPGAPLRPLEWVTPPPVHEEVSFPWDETEVPADLYRPRHPGRYGALVLSLGVNPNPRDPLLLRLTDGLARVGVVVLIPRPGFLAQNRLDPREAEALLAGFRYLKAHPLVDDDRVGLGGFCAGASMALLAAEDESINEEVALVHFFGGYYDLLELLRAVARRQMGYGPQERPWEPTDLTKEIFALYLKEALKDPRDRHILERRLVEREEADLQRLSPTGRLIYEILTTPDPSRARALAQELPDEMRALLEELSPSSGIERLKAPIFVIHDRDDTFIPCVESRRLVKDVRGPKRYTEFALFEHLYPTRPLGLLTLARELLKLYLHLYLALREVA